MSQPSARRAAIVGLIGPLFWVACSSPPSFRFVALSQRMPELSGRTLDGLQLSPSDYAGKMLLINFWASWCAPCRREQPALEALWRRLSPRGDVQFVGVNSQDRTSAAREWVADFQVTYPSVSDPDGAVGRRFDVPFLPTTILVDRSGHLRYRLVGEQKAAFLEGLLEVLASLGSRAEQGP